MRLEAVLYDPEQHESGWLFLARGIDWELQSEALVLNLEEVLPENERDEGAGIPQIARDRQLFPVLQIVDVQGIVQNARSQRPQATPSDLLTAFKFYIDRDAFIEF